MLKKIKLKLTKKRIVILALLLSLIMIGFIISLISDGVSKKMKFQNDLTSLLAQQKGTFKYVIDVKSDNYKKVDNLELISTLDTVSFDITNPKYTITIEGNVKSISPAEAHYSISIDTDYSKGELLDVTVINSKYYINLNTLRTWLKDSKLEELIEEMNGIPESTKYLCMEENELHFYSSFAEDTEINDSSLTSLNQLISSITTWEKIIIESMSMSSDTTNKQGIVSYSATDNIKKGITNLLLTSTYKDYANKNKSLTSENLAQLTNEYDNRKVWGFMTYMENIYSNKFSDFKVNLSSGKTVNDRAIAYDVSGDITFKYNKTPFTITVQLDSKNTRSVEIIEPKGSTCNYTELKQTGFNFDSLSGSLNHYFNTFNINRTIKLETTTSKIYSDLLDSTVTYLDNTIEGIHLTKYTVVDWLTNNLGNDNVKSLYNTINSITGGVVIENTVEKQDEVVQYPKIYTSTDDLRIELQTSIQESTDNFLVIDTTLLNTLKNKRSIDLTKFVLYDIDRNKYPSNNKIQIKALYPKYDFNTLPLTSEIQINGYADTKLYFVINPSKSVYILEYNGVVLGTIRNY